MGNYFDNMPAVPGEDSPPLVTFDESDIVKSIEADSLDLYSLPITSGGAKVNPTMRLNPSVNKDYFKLRPSPMKPTSKIPQIDYQFLSHQKKDASVKISKDPIDSIFNNPYDDYNLNYKYWEDDSWNIDAKSAVDQSDLWKYSAAVNPLFQDISSQEIN